MRHVSLKDFLPKNILEKLNSVRANVSLTIRRTFSLIFALIFFLVALGATVAAIHQAIKIESLERNGVSTIGEVIEFIYSEDRSYRRKRGTRVTKHYDHTISFDGHLVVLDLDKEVPIGSNLPIFYDSTEPKNSVVFDGNPSFWKILEKKYSYWMIGILFLIPGFYFISWRLFKNFYDPLSEKEIGIKFKFPNDEKSKYRKALNKITNEVIVNGEERSEMIFLAIISAFDIQGSKASTLKNGTLQDLALYEVGCFVLASACKITEASGSKDYSEIKKWTTLFVLLSSEVLKSEIHLVESFIANRLNTYGNLSNPNKNDYVEYKALLLNFLNEPMLKVINSTINEEPLDPEQALTIWFEKTFSILNTLVINSVLSKSA